jgi:hypothetical protein
LPNVGNAWRTDILENDDEETPLNETRMCLLALFRRDGEPRAAVGEHTDQLRDNPLMFIQMIYIRPQFSRQGLLRPALECFYDALSQLPEWFAFAGSLVLVPGPPDDAKGNVWAGRDLKDVENTLANIYRGQGFTIWIHNGKVRGELITVMGRATP